MGTPRPADRLKDIQKTEQHPTVGEDIGTNQVWQDPVWLQVLCFVLVAGNICKWTSLHFLSAHTSTWRHGYVKHSIECLFVVPFRIFGCILEILRASNSFNFIVFLNEALILTWYNMYFSPRLFLIITLVRQDLLNQHVQGPRIALWWSNWCQYAPTHGRNRLCALASSWRSTICYRQGILSDKNFFSSSSWNAFATHRSFTLASWRCAARVKQRVCSSDREQLFCMDCRRRWTVKQYPFLVTTFSKNPSILIMSTTTIRSSWKFSKKASLRLIRGNVSASTVV